MKLSATVLIFFVVIFGIAHSGHGSRRPRRCRRVRPYRDSWLRKPPVAKVDLKRYLGTWYVIYANPLGLAQNGDRCWTARYTKESKNKIGALFCNLENGQPQCDSGTLMKRKGGMSNARQTLTIPPGSATSRDFNIVALLGDKEYGYYATAELEYEMRNGEMKIFWYILSRNPFMPRRAFRMLLRKLRCLGYPIFQERFIKVRHGRGCKYFFS